MGDERFWLITEISEDSEVMEKEGGIAFAFETIQRAEKAFEGDGGFARRREY